MHSQDALNAESEDILHSSMYGYHRLEKKNNFCPLLDASLVMLWLDMAYVEMYVNQDKKK